MSGNTCWRITPSTSFRVFFFLQSGSFSVVSAVRAASFARAQFPSPGLLW